MFLFLWHLPGSGVLSVWPFPMTFFSLSAHKTSLADHAGEPSQCPSHFLHVLTSFPQALSLRIEIGGGQRIGLWRWVTLSFASSVCLSWVLLLSSRPPIYFLQHVWRPSCMHIVLWIDVAKGASLTRNCSSPPRNAYVAHILTSAYICQVYPDRRTRKGRQMREENPRESESPTTYGVCTFSSFIPFTLLIMWTEIMNLVFQ